MAFGASASITAEGMALSVTGAIDASRGCGYDRTCGCPTADRGVDFVMSPPPPPPSQEYSQANTRLCNNRVTAQAVSTAGNIPARGRNAAAKPRNLSHCYRYASGTCRNLYSSRKYASDMRGGDRPFWTLSIYIYQTFNQSNGGVNN
jgi:hypothetical protein